MLIVQITSSNRFSWYREDIGSFFFVKDKNKNYYEAGGESCESGKAVTCLIYKPHAVVVSVDPQSVQSVLDAYGLML